LTTCGGIPHENRIGSLDSVQRICTLAMDSNDDFVGQPAEVASSITQPSWHRSGVRRKRSRVAVHGGGRSRRVLCSPEHWSKVCSARSWMHRLSASCIFRVISFWRYGLLFTSLFSMQIRNDGGYAAGNLPSRQCILIQYPGAREVLLHVRDDWAQPLHLPPRDGRVFTGGNDLQELW
jgi:hypothetical protein